MSNLSSQTETALREFAVYEGGVPVPLSPRTRKMLAFVVAMDASIDSMYAGHLRFDFGPGELVPELREAFRKIRVE